MIDVSVVELVSKIKIKKHLSFPCRSSNSKSFRVAVKLVNFKNVLNIFFFVNQIIHYLTHTCEKKLKQNSFHKCMFKNISGKGEGVQFKSNGEKYPDFTVLCF